MRSITSLCILLNSSSESTEMKLPVNESLSARYTRITGVVALYWFVSITLVFLNKKLLSGSSTFSAPLFVTWFQCVVTVGLLYLLQALFSLFPRYNKTSLICLTANTY